MNLTFNGTTLNLCLFLGKVISINLKKTYGIL